VLPILSHLVLTTGNRNKLKIALALVRALVPIFSRPVRVLFDSWLMRARRVLPLLSRGIAVIGQARIDTALFFPPEEQKVRGRGQPQIYGKRLTPKDITALPTVELTLNLYGKEQKIWLRLVMALACFLKGRKVCAV
jgi:hypothetical protein